MHRLAFTLALVLAAIMAASSATGAHKSGPIPGSGCGGTLWRLMTLSDADRARVDLARTPSSIADLAGLRPPGAIGLRRTTRFTLHDWRLRVVIDRYRIASNGEIVLILYSIPTGSYMNAYLPNPHCLTARTRDRTGILAARHEFTDHCPHATAAWQLLGATVDLSGVGFWNPVRTTRGALPNGAELRPLTNLEIVSGCGVATS
jgi:hypothetical protein